MKKHLPIIVCSLFVTAGLLMTGSHAWSDPKVGGDIFKSKCAVCHGQEATGTPMAPDISHVAGTRDKKFLTEWLTDPQAKKPGTKMPKPNLTDAERASIVDFLLTKK